METAGGSRARYEGRNGRVRDGKGGRSSIPVKGMLDIREEHGENLWGQRNPKISG